jgi:pSer/pThr/pTyr-binding forkhead associated (FHA) protein
MRVLQLSAVVRDLRTTTMTVQPFLRSPVTIGRRDSNALRLDAGSVSRIHGAFLFGKGLLEYVDTGSRNGTFVDGVLIEPNEPVDIRDSSVLTVGPFQIIVHLELIELRRRPSDPEEVTSTIMPAPGPEIPSVSLWKDSLRNGPAFQRLLSRHGQTDVLRRAAEIVEVVSELVVKFRGAPDHSASPLGSAETADQILAYLLDPDDASGPTDELRTLLTELLRFPLTVLNGGHQ